MKEHKRTLLILLALVIVLSVGMTAGTYAYQTQTETAHNIITTSAGVKAEIVEYAEDPHNPGQLIPYVDPDFVIPDMSVSKLPVVKNTGDVAMYVRIMLAKDIRFAEESKENPSASVVILRYHGAEGLNTADWTDGGDGYWYYNKALKAGEETAPLFDEVYFSPEMGDQYIGSTATVTIQGQAVQADNNGSSVWEANGWPEAK